MKLKTGIAVLFMAFGVLFILAPTVMGEIYSHSQKFKLSLYPIHYHHQIACWSAGIAFICVAFLLHRPALKFIN